MTYIKTNSLGAPKTPSYEFDSVWFTNIPYEIEDGNLKATSNNGGSDYSLRIRPNTIPSDNAGNIYADKVETQLYIKKYYEPDGSESSWNKATFKYDYTITNNLVAGISLSSSKVTCKVVKNGSTTTTVGTLPMESPNTSIYINYKSDSNGSSGVILFGAVASDGTVTEHEYVVDYDATLAADKVQYPGFTSSKLGAISTYFVPIFDGSLTKVKIVDTSKSSGYLESTLIKIA